MQIKYSRNDVNNKNRLSKFFHYQKRSEFRKYSMNANKDAKSESSSITQDWINCIKHIKPLSNYTKWAKYSDDLQFLPFFFWVFWISNESSTNWISLQISIRNFHFHSQSYFLAKQWMIDKIFYFLLKHLKIHLLVPF